MITFTRFALILLLSAGMVMAYSQMKPGKVGFIPKNGFVPSAEVAQAIAEAVLLPVYGKETVISERPFKATLHGGVWIITGSVPCDNPPPGAVCPGGSAEVRISKKTGQILHMTHSQ
jgi:NTF2 fold immunity protein of polymorphic toxin system component